VNATNTANRHYSQLIIVSDMPRVMLWLDKTGKKKREDENDFWFYIHS